MVRQVTTGASASSNEKWGHEKWHKNGYLTSKGHTRGNSIFPHFSPVRFSNCRTNTFSVTFYTAQIVKLIFLKKMVKLKNMVITNVKKIEELLTRNVEEVIVKKDLIRKLKSGKILRVKHGVDPTTKDLHLGHAVTYWKLREFQEMGHKIVFLIGDFTGRFGDPTEQLKTRRLKTKKEVQKIAKDYLKQVGRILDIKKIELRHNSEWFDKWSWEKGLRFMSQFTTARMLERDMFVKRIKQGREIAYHEPVYPMLQAYDSAMLKSDVTVIGTDQKFNELLARPLQEKAGQKPQDLVIVPLLLGIDGKRKMSQSLGNQINISDPPEQMYGKTMSIPDNLIIDYFKLCTRFTDKEIKKIELELKRKEVNPRDKKAQLAFEIVKLYYGQKAALGAAKAFEKVFKKKEIPSKIPQITIKEKQLNILDLLVKTKLVPSRSGAKRLVLQKGVKVDGKVQSDWKKTIKIKKGLVIQVGKKKFLKTK